MALIPATKAGKIEFNESHLPAWQTNAVAIGSSAAEITDLQTKTTAARAALQAQQAAQDAARSATITLNDAIDAMMAVTSKVIAEVRLKAKTAGNSVYALADVPEPAIPSPMPTPGEPYKFNVMLVKSGGLEMNWRCDNPAGSGGTTYQIWRRNGADPEGEFVYLGTSGSRRFVDETIPAGTSSVVYRLQAVRSTAAGTPAEFTVSFSTSSSGTVTTRVTPSSPAKMAA